MNQNWLIFNSMNLIDPIPFIFSSCRVIVFTTLHVSWTCLRFNELPSFLCELQTSDVTNVIWTTGCVEAAIQTAQDNIFLLGGVGLGIVIPQVISYPCQTSPYQL